MHGSMFVCRCVSVVVRCVLFVDRLFLLAFVKTTMLRIVCKLLFNCVRCLLRVVCCAACGLM